MDYTIWGIGTALIGALCYLAGRLHGMTQPKPQEELRHMEPVTRPMQAVEHPAEEHPTQVVPALDIWADLDEMERKGQIW
jgi:hypothetical protein